MSSRISLIILLMTLAALPQFGSRQGPLPSANAATLSITLIGRISAWNSTTNPNPTLTATQGDTVSLDLTSGDGAPHRFFIDVNRNNAPDCATEKCSDFFPPDTTDLFTADFSPGTYKYYCSVHPLSMVGNFQLLPPPHDVAVTGLVSKKFVYAGVSTNPIKVNVTVANLGTNVETFTVTAKANLTITIGSQTITNLAAGASTLATIPWNTNTLAIGNYTLSAQASTVPGETNTANNNFADGVLRVKKTGDVNGDGVVTVDDVLLAAVAWGGIFNPNADMNGDGVITIDDVLITAVNWK